MSILPEIWNKMARQKEIGNFQHPAAVIPASIVVPQNIYLCIPCTISSNQGCDMVHKAWFCPTSSSCQTHGIGGPQDSRNYRKTLSYTPLKTDGWKDEKEHTYQYVSHIHQILPVCLVLRAGSFPGCIYHKVSLPANAPISCHLHQLSCVIMVSLLRCIHCLDFQSKPLSWSLINTEGNMEHPTEIVSCLIKIMRIGRGPASFLMLTFTAGGCLFLHCHGLY